MTTTITDFRIDTWLGKPAVFLASDPSSPIGRIEGGVWLAADELAPDLDDLTETADEAAALLAELTRLTEAFDA